MIPVDGSASPDGRADQLDTAFYGGFYTDLRHLSPAQLVNHWLASGRRGGRFANLGALLASYAQDGVALPAGFSVSVYRWLNPDLRAVHSADWEFVLHYLDFGRHESRPTRIADPAFFDELHFAGRRPSTQDIEALLAADEPAYLSLSSMLEANGIFSRAFVTLFDPNDYLTLFPDAGLLNGIQCLRHFVETGRHALAPVSLDYAFDPRFYAEICPQAAALKPAEAYLHWLNEGIHRQAAPNQAIFLQQLGLPDLDRLPSGFDAALYLSANPDLRATCGTPWLALQHFIQYGAAENRAGILLTRSSLKLHVAAADRLAVTQPETAKSLYEAILLIDPNHAHVLSRLAAILADRGEYFFAAGLCQRQLEQERQRGQDPSLAALTLLAECQLRLRQWSACCATWNEIFRAHPGDVGIAARRRAATTICFEALSQCASLLACHGALEQGRETMAAAASLLTGPILAAGPVVNRARQRIRTVAIVADVSLPQCRFYRVEQKLEQLVAAGIKARLFDHTIDLAAYADQVPFLDAVIFYRVPATPGVVEAIEQARRAGLPTFYEIDDPIFDELHYPDTLESYGGQISTDVYAGLVTGTALFKAAMSLCDYGIASTPTLATTMAPHVLSGQVHLHRNALGTAHQAAMARIARRTEPRGRVRIFYGTATRAHNADFTDYAAPALARLLAEHRDDVELVVMGYLTLPDNLEPFRDRITCLDPVWDLAVYWEILAEMDVNLAILKPGQAADCKSEIKWLEAAMLGIPTVATATATMRDVIDDGFSGLLAETPSDWLAALRSLAADPMRRRRIGEAARWQALRSYGPDSMAANLTAMFASVTDAPKRTSRPRRQKILLVHVFFPPQATGGATRVVAGNVEDLAREYGDHFEIEVFTTIEGGTTPYRMSAYLWQGIKITGITTPDDPQINLRAKDPQIEAAFAALVDRFKPDIIHIHCIQRLTTSICDVALRNKIPYVITVHDGWWISESQFLLDEYGRPDMYNYADQAGELQRRGAAGFARMRALTSALSGAERILAVSEPFARLYRAQGFDRVQTIENGLPSFTILPRTPSPDGRVRLTHAGGTTNYKGFHTIKAALCAAKLDRLHLTVVDHAMLPGTTRTARWGATEVRFQPKLPQHRVGELYAATDVLLALSVWPESYGLVTREALAAGCWVIASDRGAVGADVTAGSGFVIGVDSYEPLLETLELINARPDRYLGPIEPPASLRPARAQADEIAAFYRELRHKRR
jgi:glycosyltransferase involved in cell wall biosynthesis/tetratricopeptide (TPR) repeat protein